MTTDHVAWGIIGLGGIAEAFAHGLEESRTGILKAVASRDLAKAKAFSDKHRHAAHGAPTPHGSYDSILLDPAVHAIYVATPHPQHAEWAIKCARAGKHVLVEKPMGLNHAEAMAMFAAADEANVLMAEAFMYRCHPQTAKLVDLIRNRAIGDVRVIQATFSFHAGFNPSGRLFANELAGGGILDVGCYTTSISRLIAGAARQQEVAEPIDVQGVASLGATGVDEWAIASLRFPGDILAQLSTGISVNQDNTLRIFGSDGKIVLENPYVANRGGPDVGQIAVYKKDAKEPQQFRLDTESTSYTLEIDTFGEAVLSSRRDMLSPAMTRADTLGNLMTLDRWRESIGLVYTSEQPDAATHTITRDPLTRRPDAQAMPTGQIPHLDKPVSRLVMGCDNQMTMPHAAVMFDDFFSRGGNAFDTAYIYGGGKPEKLVGRWIASRGVRSDVTVFVKGAHTPFCTPAVLAEQLKQSLDDRLKIESADVYLLHRDNVDVPVGEFVDVLNQLMRAGRVKAFGGSNWSVERIAAANAYATEHRLQGMSVLSNQFSAARAIDVPWKGCRTAGDDASRAWLAKTQTVLLAWSSQARGFFTDRSGPDKTEDEEMVRCWYSPENFKRKARIIAIATELKVTPVAVALAYVLQQPFPTFAVIGPRTLEETRTSLAGLTVKLNADEIAAIDGAK